MYQALYRKYRPKSFSEVVGQDIIKKIITNEINSGKISHAYLFCGPRGTGKTSIAKLIAKLINCNNQKDGMPCNECESCIQFNNKNYVDIIEIDAASNNGVDEIRELRNKANLLPASSKYKIYIIDEVHMLSIGAFNALLKTLEEPPKHVVFILATTEVNKIPITIISRCQRFDFNRISEQKIFERLKYISKQENIKINDAALKEISTLTDGGLRDAIGILDKIMAYTTEDITPEIVHFVNYSLNNNEIKKLFELLYDNKIEEYINYISEINDRGIDLFKVIDQLMLYLRNILLNKVPNNYSKSVIINYINELNNLSNKMRTTNYPKILLETFIVIVNKNTENTKFTLQNENKTIKSKLLVKEEQIQSNIKENEQQEINSKCTNEEVHDNIIKESVETKKIDNVQDLIKIRINNTFATCNKQSLTNLKNKWKNINEYAVSTIYGIAPGILMDGELVVASESNIIVVYPYTSMSERANNNISTIEKLLTKVFDKEYIFIALDQNTWNKTKKEYINNIKNKVEYIYYQEDVDYNNLFESESNEIVDQAVDIFGEDLVQVI